MNPAQAAAFIAAQTALMLVELEGMKAHNARLPAGHGQAYSQKDFLALYQRNASTIGHNASLMIFQEANR